VIAFKIVTPGAITCLMKEKEARLAKGKREGERKGGRRKG
jgi:hypothetical protein